MDALTAAFVAAILAQLGERTPWLAAILADRYGKPWLVLAMAALALAAVYALGTVGGILLAPLLADRPKLLLLALALVSAGGASLVAPKTPERLAGWRIGAAATSLLGLFIMAFGDRAQFIVLTLAARSPLPAASAVGATLGALVVVAPAVLMGEAAWLKLPHRALRLASAGVLLVAGVIIGLSALALI